MKKTTMLVFLFMAILFFVSGCARGKKFESAESMIEEMSGTYAAEDEHEGEYVVIDGKNVIKFDIDNIFPQITDKEFFDQNFPAEDWVYLSLDTLLEKPYVETDKEPVSADIKQSTLSGLWISKDGVLYSQKKNGYPYKKISSDCNYPTAEMEQKFGDYIEYLGEYELSLIIEEAGTDFADKQKSLEYVLSSAFDSASPKSECLASPETVANCAFDSLIEEFPYPRSASLDYYRTEPLKDSYGRVATIIDCTYQNRYGNYVAESFVVILQSCSVSGEYTYKPGWHWVTFENAESLLTTLMTINDWDQDPNYDASKESEYEEGVRLAKDGEYEAAIEKLQVLDGYRASDRVISACSDYIISQQYKKAVDLFAAGKYSEAAEAIARLTYSGEDGYGRSERVVYWSKLFDKNPQNGEASNLPITEPPTVPATAEPLTGENVQGGADDAENNSSQDHGGGQSGSGGNTSSGSNGDSSSGGNASSGSNGDNSSGGTASSGGNTTVDPCADGHIWGDATCTSPATCSVCGKTSGQPLGHDIYITECRRCGYTDFGDFAHSYSDAAIIAYDLTSGEDYTVTNVKLSDEGVFSFTFNGKDYCLTVVQTNKKNGTSSLVVFDCYIDGKREPDAVFYIAPDYLNPRFEWRYLDGCYLYFYVDF